MAERDRSEQFADADFYMDTTLVDDPYPYLEYLRGQGPVTRLPHQNVVAITDFDEVVRVCLDTEHFSAVNSVTGPLPPLPFEPDPEDITDQIDSHRPQMPFGEAILTLDQPRHTGPRSIMMRLFTPGRLRAMDAQITAIAAQLLDEIDGRESCEFVAAFAKPFSSMSIAALLGVPEEDRYGFRELLGAASSEVGARDKRIVNPMEIRRETFHRYIEERRRSPRGDIMSDIATATYPDGSTPEVEEVVSIANLLFGAGQDTTAALVSAAMRILAEQHELQDALRTDMALIPAFIEEVLRIAGPVKSTHRLTQRPTELCGVEIPTGTTVMMSIAAANRDPQKFSDPTEFRLDRPRAKDHLAFGRGIHTCPGAALARTETRIGLERILDRFGRIELDETFHGSPGDRHFSYAPTYVFRALDQLHLRCVNSG